MQAKHKIGMQLRVHEDGAATDLAVAVKQHFALPSDCLLFFGIVWIENVPAYAGLRQAVFDKDFSSERFFGFGRQQRPSRAPKSRNMSLRIRIRRKTQSENVARFAVSKNLRDIMVDLDQVGCESVCAIDVVDQMGEFVVSNGFLIMLE